MDDDRTPIVGRTGFGKSYLITEPGTYMEWRGAFRPRWWRRVWLCVPQYRPGPLRCGFGRLFGCRRFGLALIDGTSLPCAHHQRKAARG